MSELQPVLKFKFAWVVVGYLIIAFVVQQTLTASPLTAGTHLPDKFLHTVGYFGLMAWFTQIYRQPGVKTVWGVFFISMGIGLEFLQGLGGIRHFEVNDMLANSLGVCIAWLLSYTRFSSGLCWLERLLSSGWR